MFGVGSITKDKRTEALIWWTVASLFGLFVIYVLIRSRHNF